MEKNMIRIMRASQYGMVTKTEEKGELTIVDRKYIGMSVVFLIKQYGMYIVIDNHNAYYPYQKLETAKLSFEARCNYLEKKYKEIG